MKSEKRTGIILMILGVVGGMIVGISYSANSFISEESQMALIVLGIVSFTLLLIGLYYLTATEESSASTDTITKTEVKLEGDLVDRLRKTNSVGVSTTRTVGTAGAYDGKGIQKTLDAMYAGEHASWICPRCETINPNSTGSCPVCGYVR